jgi:CelD/BcsL family acetyltransferase involved in cellulose biosynthesis
LSDSVLVRDATDADAEAWNAFLDSRPGSSPLARYEWRAVLTRSYGVATLFLLAEREGRVTGVLPVYETPRGRPRRLHSLRFGLAVEESQSAVALIERLNEERKARGGGRASITSGRTLWPLPWPARPQKTVVLETGTDEAALWRGLRDKTRNMIRKAERAGLSISIEAEALGEFHALYSEALLRRGVPVHRRRFFESAMRGFEGRMELLTARRGGRLAAGMLLIFGRDMAAYPFQAVAEDARKFGAVQLLNWEAMRRCAQRGVGLLDMGESREGGPVYASKVNFGGRPQDVYYYDWPAPSRQAASAKPSLGAKLDQLAMQKAPLWLRRFYGERKLKLGRLL